MGCKHWLSHSCSECCSKNTELDRIMREDRGSRGSWMQMAAAHVELCKCDGNAMPRIMFGANRLCCRPNRWLERRSKR